MTAAPGEPGDRAPRPPADVRCLHQRVDEEQHAAGDEEGSEGVEVRQPCADPVALEQDESTGETNGAEGDVDEQHPAPARPLGEQAAEEDAGGAADPGDCSPDAKGGVAVAGGTERARQRRQRGR
jgi:hypothetical protein